MSDYAPIITIKIELTSNYYFASRDYYDGSGNYYKGTLLNTPALVESMPDLYYGAEINQSLTLKFANPIDAGPDDNWYTIANTEELREAWVTLGLYDVDDGSSTLYRGKISSYVLGDVMEIKVDMRNDAILDTLLPKQLINTDDFDSTAIDVGHPVNICFGRCKNVPLRNIQYDTINNEYDYLIGYGTIEGLYTSSGFGVHRDNGTIVNPTEYTLYDGSQASPWAGYAFIRFGFPQQYPSGGYVNFFADVHGLELGGAVRERNFATLIGEVLSNTTWGLSDDIDATSFSNAETILDDSYYRCEFAITKQRKARDILNDMLFPARGAYIYRGDDGEWEITVPTTGSSAAIFGENDGYYNNCRIVSMTVPGLKETYKNVIIQYDYGGGSVPRQELTYAVKTFGADKTYQFKTVQGEYTADKIASYFYRLAQYEHRCTIEAGLEARSLRRGDIITVIAPDKPPISSGKDYIITKIGRLLNLTSKTTSGYRMDLREYNSALYGDETITTPPTYTPPDNEVTEPIADQSTWITKTANFTAEVNKRYKIDTDTAGADITMTLPASPADKDYVGWLDVANNFGTYKLIIGRNGKNIMGYAEDMWCTNNGESGRLEYDSDTASWMFP